MIYHHMAADTQFENPNLITMNEELQVMSGPNATTGVDVPGQGTAPLLNGVQGPVRELDLDGEVLRASRTVGGQGHPDDRMGAATGPSAMTGGQLREEAARFLMTTSSSNTECASVSGTAVGAFVWTL